MHDPYEHSLASRRTPNENKHRKNRSHFDLAVNKWSIKQPILFFVVLRQKGGLGVGKRGINF